MYGNGIKIQGEGREGEKFKVALDESAKKNEKLLRKLAKLLKEDKNE